MHMELSSLKASLMSRTRILSLALFASLRVFSLFTLSSSFFFCLTGSFFFILLCSVVLDDSGSLGGVTDTRSTPETEPLPITLLSDVLGWAAEGRGGKTW
jgi:hypothetical protein